MAAKRSLALISPKGNVTQDARFKEFFEQAPQIKGFHAFWTGMGLAMPILAALTPDEWSVDVLDENVSCVDTTRDYDLVGITGMTQQATRAYELADNYRSRGIPVVMGGIHTTVAPEESRLHADAIVIGEAEEIWHGLLEDFKAGRLKPVYQAERLPDLAISPVPRYDFQTNMHGAVYVQATRGCPHDCEFCAASRVYGKGYRTKSVDQMMKELAHVKQLHPNKLLYFADDNFTVKREFAKSLIREMIPFRFRFAIQSDISLVQDDELLDLLQQAGCTFVFIGFESLNPESLSSINENTWKLRRLGDYATAIDRIQSLGMGVFGAFIMGLDHDTEKVFENTARFIIDNNLYGFQLTVPTPFPGTRLRERMEAERRLLDLPWSYYTCSDVVIRPKLMSPERLQEGLVDVFRACADMKVIEAKLAHLKRKVQEFRKKKLAKPS